MVFINLDVTWHTTSVHLINFVTHPAFPKHNILRLNGCSPNYFSTVLLLGKILICTLLHAYIYLFACVIAVKRSSLSRWRINNTNNITIYLSFLKFIQLDKLVYGKVAVIVCTDKHHGCIIEVIGLVAEDARWGMKQLTYLVTVVALVDVYIILLESFSYSSKFFFIKLLNLNVILLCSLFTFFFTIMTAHIYRLLNLLL